MPKVSRSQKPQVSIVIRTKNEQRTIGKVLGALVKQTFQDFEIILVDDNSTDRTLEIVKKFSKEFPIKIIRLKPGEFSHPYSLNLGASKARGEYLCFLAGHSVPISNTWLADGLTNFRDPKVAGVSGNYTGIPIGYYSQTLGRLFFLPKQRKRKVFNFDEKLPECEDYDWACEMLARGYNIIKDPKFSVFHSHLFLGQRINYFTRQRRWDALISQINKRKRPQSLSLDLKFKTC